MRRRTIPEVPWGGAAVKRWHRTAADCRPEMSEAVRLAFEGKYLEAALTIWNARPEYGRRLLFMAAGTPMKNHQDYWAEPCAWDWHGSDTPPMVIVEMRAELSELKKRKKLLKGFLYRERKREIKAAFKGEGQ